MKRNRTLVRIKGIMWGKARCLVPEWNPYETVGFPVEDFPTWVLERLPGNAVDPNTIFPDFTLLLFANANIDVKSSKQLDLGSWEDSPQDALKEHIAVTKKAPNGGNQAGYEIDKEAKQKGTWLEKMATLKKKNKAAGFVDGCNCEDCKKTEAAVTEDTPCECSYCLTEKSKNQCSFCKEGTAHGLCDDGDIPTSPLFGPNGNNLIQNETISSDSSSFYYENNKPFGHNNCGDECEIIKEWEANKTLIKNKAVFKC